MHRAPIIDPDSTLLIIFGPDKYARLPEIKAARNAAAQLAQIFMDPAIAGLQSDHILLLTSDTIAAEQMTEAYISAKIAEALDSEKFSKLTTLLFICIGHGIPGFRMQDRGRLFLATFDTIDSPIADRLHKTALLLDDLVKSFRKRFTRSILILECCNSDIAASYVIDDGFFTRDELKGVYILASTSKGRPSYYHPDEPYTDFSGALIHILKHGDETAVSHVITNDDLLRLLRKKVKYSIPQARNDLAPKKQFSFCYNRKCNLNFVRDCLQKSDFRLANGFLFQIIRRDLYDPQKRPAIEEVIRLSLDRMREVERFSDVARLLYGLKALSTAIDLFSVYSAYFSELCLQALVYFQRQWYQKALVLYRLLSLIQPGDLSIREQLSLCEDKLSSPRSSKGRAKIVMFKADADRNVAGGLITFYWTVEHALKIELIETTGAGIPNMVGARDKFRLITHRDCCLRLVATDASGSQDVAEIFIRVFQPPRIELIPLPKPGLSITSSVHIDNRLPPLNLDITIPDPDRLFLPGLTDPTRHIAQNNLDNNFSIYAIFQSISGRIRDRLGKARFALKKMAHIVFRRRHQDSSRVPRE